MRGIADVEGKVLVQLTLDHLVVSCTRLEDGVAHVEAALGVTMAPGGKHAVMGTHNALLSLGTAYLEVIAIDPDAEKPTWPRIFDLDNFDGPPRLTHWVANPPDLAAALAMAPEGAGSVMEVSRGDLTWQMAVPGDGKLPFGGAFPGLIQWPEGVHPLQRLPDASCDLTVFQVAHPDAAGLRNALNTYAGGLADHVVQTATAGLRAAIKTPGGLRVLT